MGPVKVEIATTLTPAIVDAVERLVGQLSRSAPPPTTAELGDIVASPATDLFIAIDDGGTIVGTATLVTFRIPTGMRAWIEDVVVDEAGRGQGVGTALDRGDGRAGAASWAAAPSTSPRARRGRRPTASTSGPASSPATPTSTGSTSATVTDVG